jgi:hypothetical protein
MDSTEILLIIVLVLTTIFLTVVGVQLILTLIEARKTLKNVNRVIDGFESAGIQLNQSVTEIGGFVSGFKSLMRMFEVISTKKHEQKTK